MRSGLIANGEWRRVEPAARNAALHDEFAQDVHRLVWRVMGGDPEHEDLVHQVFARVFATAHRVRDDRRLRSWVVSVTLNLVRTELRKRRLRSSVVFWGAADPDQLPAHVDARHDLDRLMQLRALLEKMGPVERIVFVLRHVEGMTVAEISEVSGYATATVNRRLARANKRIERAGRRSSSEPSRRRKEQSYQPG